MWGGTLLLVREVVFYIFLNVIFQCIHSRCSWLYADRNLCNRYVTTHTDKNQNYRHGPIPQKVNDGFFFWWGWGSLAELTIWCEFERQKAPSGPLWRNQSNVILILNRIDFARHEERKLNRLFLPFKATFLDRKRKKNDSSIVSHYCNTFEHYGLDCGVGALSFLSSSSATV